MPRDPIGVLVVPVVVTAPAALDLLREVGEHANVNMRQHPQCADAVRELLRLWGEDLEHPRLAPRFIKLRVVIDFGMTQEDSRGD